METVTALASGFWLLAEAVIVLTLVYCDARLRRGRFFPQALPYLTLFVGGCVLILRADSLFAEIGVHPFGRRLVWNLLCLTWVLFEWSMLYFILRIVAAAAGTFLGRAEPEMTARVHIAVAALFCAATFIYHAAMYELDSASEIGLRAYGFVRLAGFAYVGIEIAIAWALYRAWRVTQRLAASL